MLDLLLDKGRYTTICFLGMLASQYIGCKMYDDVHFTNGYETLKNNDLALSPVGLGKGKPNHRSYSTAQALD